MINITVAGDWLQSGEKLKFKLDRKLVATLPYCDAVIAERNTLFICDQKHSSVAYYSAVHQSLLVLRLIRSCCTPQSTLSFLLFNVLC